ncbi:tRNA modification GTPase [Methylohalomonas lacus]|uniref:tRNA modification GTPase MnmE n=1 Tax=Methylohalomonas lacus TaxID=398773 RepID=A0AAE3HJ47_9GAMM|nr:tRNA uridine-5-carboxymethylaminomethyl(34) synthesis GTPase MnmE [Methylohalomonas lacus]MCS3903334.1 tRNA modification GTPase [Methylohalomonas lacus]
MSAATDTIAAVATPSGRGGIGVVRLSGPACRSIATSLLGRVPEPRHASYGAFRDAAGELIDRGIALYFPAPHSYTGEDVLELQGHGGDMVMQLLLAAAIDQGARQARPGEFTERAFLNDRLDLLQAEAVADLIDSHSAAAARGALRSLQGEFSQTVNEIRQALVDLRVKVEGALDFPDEDLEIILGDSLDGALRALLARIANVQQQAQQGRLLNSGVDIAIVGAPNVGKSSLINRLSRSDAAIVTDIPGTTRDPIRSHCLLDDLPVVLTDTAGLRDSTDVIEQEGIRRANRALGQADLVLWLNTTAQPDSAALEAIHAQMAPGATLLHVHNKIDQQNLQAYRLQDERGQTRVGLSALTGAGIDLLVDAIKEQVGYGGGSESVFSARERHLQALAQTHAALQQAVAIAETVPTLELVAENLRQAQDALTVLTGEFSADDLLGEIFARFCIGK